MIELEVQVLAHTREGLLMEIGRIVSASGFTLQRQRLVADPHGALLTLVVSGPARRQRALDNALGEHERVISFEIAPAEGAQMRPHFALTRRIDHSDYVPPPAPEPLPEAQPAPATPKRPMPPAFDASPAPALAAAFDAVPPISRVEPRVAAEPLLQGEPSLPSGSPSPAGPPPQVEPPPPPARPEPLWVTDPEFALPQPPPPPAPAPAPLDPYVEIAPLPPDVTAVARLLADVDELSPQRLVPALLDLDRTVAPGAREPTLQLAGQRIGEWLAMREPGSTMLGSLDEAIADMGVRALSALVAVDAQGSQLHLRESPLCTQAGHSGCAFFSGLLHGVLTPVLPSHEVSLFNVCCRAWGADECVLAVSE